MRKGAYSSQDTSETLEDAVRIAVGDQIEAGLDIITDGEMLRHRFVFGLYQHLEGIERIEPRRLVGAPGYDTAPRYRRTGRISAPKGFGMVEDLLVLSRHAPNRPIKTALPGPITIAEFISADGHDDLVVAEAVDIVRGELESLVSAGAQWIQLDEPAVTSDAWNGRLGEAVAAINSSLANTKAYVGLHVCFGNNIGRPMSERTLSRLFPDLLGVECDQFVLEFANRQMAEADLWGRLGDKRDLAAGVIDVKSFHLESPELVARRLRAVLEGMNPARLTATADCGFSATPRWLARAKARALVEGASLVREDQASG